MYTIDIFGDSFSHYNSRYTSDITWLDILNEKYGIKNFYNWIDVGGFDNFLFRPNGKVSSILAREAFINLLHPMQPFKFGIKMFASKMALKFNIDLVISMPKNL